MVCVCVRAWMCMCMGGCSWVVFGYASTTLRWLLDDIISFISTGVKLQE